ncbi:MAG: hypothetical protein K2K52_07355 [Paramuribaculum sp.]|nr:hypothetical protein [Paramuribaculum sp.]MDE6460628.1 hypothetical protein [Paramuribaculum sp.]
MSDKEFTSGEKRGLIVLLVIMGAIVGWSLISKSCVYNSDKVQAPSEREIIVHDSLTRINDSNKLFKPEKRKIRQRKVRQQKIRPDGRKRDYLAEPVD